ncbi:MAG: sulfur transferase domain-containing protein [Gemmatimonadota bacterium]
MSRETMLRTAVIAMALALGIVCAPGCGGAETVNPGPNTVESGGENAEPRTAAAEPGTEAVRSIPAGVAALQIRNVRLPMPGLLTGGQLTADQMIALRESGYRHFISLRPADENGAGWEEEFAASEGIAFTRIAIAGATGIDRENAERLDARLAQAGSEPTVLYCGSGNRVGALIALRAHLIEGIGAEEALALGKEAGLTRLEPKVREALSLSSE